MNVLANNGRKDFNVYKKLKIFISKLGTRVINIGLGFSVPVNSVTLKVICKSLLLPYRG